MSGTANLEDWAGEVATNIYRISLHHSVFGRYPSNKYRVTGEELAAIDARIRDLSEAEYATAIEQAREDAWEVYRRVYRRHSTPSAPNQIN
ncbi:hypothetical protein G6321_00050220 [Bradyrhizobium barranii subsp. barranii]|uniref:Uncharacterized protein n=1 Tax=Bradyrhizobium barranii subsp. barranii TaxID=2823807 RepID=A0A7Z0QBK7_9BRAD|nr:hypothetical protein [Bradyrhizobium barranii]UGX93674.1 hypothetical protein G6321_00050220 [Bradyrhizobium barranii subsp. barranii]